MAPPKSMFILIFCLFFCACKVTANTLTAESRRWIENTVAALASQGPTRSMSLEYGDFIVRWMAENSRSQDIDNAYFHFRCEHLLLGFDSSLITGNRNQFGNDSFWEKIRHDLRTHLSRIPLLRRSSISRQFRRLPNHQRANLLTDYLQNLEEVEELIDRRTSHLKPNSFNSTDVFMDLLGISLQSHTSQFYFNDSVELFSPIRLRGAEINTSVKVLRHINDRLRLIMTGNLAEPLSGKFVDFGSGFGIPGIAFRLLNPKLEYVGYEIDDDKIKASRKLHDSVGLRNSVLAHQDLSLPDFVVPIADYYYFYNSVPPPVAEKISAGLKRVSKQKRIYIIVNWGPWIPSWNQFRLAYSDRDGLAIFTAGPQSEI